MVSLELIYDISQILRKLKNNSDLKYLILTLHFLLFKRQTSSIMGAEGASICNAGFNTHNAHTDYWDLSQSMSVDARPLS